MDRDGAAHVEIANQRFSKILSIDSTHRSTSNALNRKPLPHPLLE